MLYSKVVIGNERPKFNFPISSCYIDLITRCWSVDPKDRPTFQNIVEELRTNKDFIIDTIDADEFYDFVDSIDETSISFDPNKKLKNIISKRDQYHPCSKENDKEIIITEKEKTINVGTFNDLPFRAQVKIITEMKEEYEEYNENLSNIYHFFQYFELFESTTEDKYFSNN